MAQLPCIGLYKPCINHLLRTVPCTLTMVYYVTDGLMFRENCTFRETFNETMGPIEVFRAYIIEISHTNK